jgi:uncharacterized iron-regulated membrane protein
MPLHCNIGNYRMRKWHRWFSFLFGAFLLFIAVTGVLSHVAAMYARGAVFEQKDGDERKAANFAPSSKAKSAPERSEKRRSPERKLVGLLHHLHSGEFFGPVGVILSLLSGLAMIFFSFSGLWIYYQMFVRRRKLGKAELFWD